MPSEEQMTVDAVVKQIEENKRRDSLVYCAVAVRRLVCEVESIGFCDVAMDLAFALQKLEKLRREEASHAG